MVISRRIYKFNTPPSCDVFLKSDEVLRCVVAEYEGIYYMYIETATNNSDILNHLNDEERIYEIFHFCPPLEAEEWVTGRKNNKAILCFNKLKPEMISSYIFYHYAFQEEMRGERRKYYTIFLSGNLLINFYETPMVMCDPKVPGLLSSNISKMDDWNERMKAHFPPNPKWVKGDILIDYTKKQ